jgi:hypothetical protein
MGLGLVFAGFLDGRLRAILAECRAMLKSVEQPAAAQAARLPASPAEYRLANPVETPAASPAGEPPGEQVAVREIGGPAGPEPTRFGDWEKKGRCIDF